MEILESLQLLLDNGVSNEKLLEVIEEMLSDGSMDDDDAKAVALYAYLNSVDDGSSFEDISLRDGASSTFDVSGFSYRILTDDEADDAFDEYLESSLDEVEGSDSHYFNRDQWKEDVKNGDGRGALASYDGEERHFSSGWSEVFYIYQTG